MLTPTKILEAALAKWPAVLRAEAAGESLFPLQIPFGRPRTTGDFETLRQGIELLVSASYNWHIDWEELNTRKWGRQRWPMRITFKSSEEMASTLGRLTELTEFRKALRTAREACPILEPWLRSKAHRIPDYFADWPGLISVCAYFDANPQPYRFARQIPLPIGTKFIEEHTGILHELLDVVLGNRVNSAGTTFEERFHLLLEPPQVRFRFLDSGLRQRVDWPVDDCSVSAPVFAQLSWDIPRVLIVENRNVFLCLPDTPRTLAIWGSGKAASVLPPCHWMNAAEIFYWGDCDEAGYGILSGLRSSFLHVRSLLMDETAWLRWKHLAIPGKRDLATQHTRLTSAEKSALAAVIAGPWMLEQERIPPIEAERAIRDALAL